MVVALGGRPRGHHVLFSKDRLDQKGRAREALTERAVTDGDALWRRQGLVAHRTTQTATLMHDCHTLGSIASWQTLRHGGRMHATWQRAPAPMPLALYFL